jgi:hypothetical protein
MVAMFHRGIYRAVFMKYTGENISVKYSEKGAGREHDNENKQGKQQGQLSYIRMSVHRR